MLFYHVKQKGIKVIYTIPAPQKREFKIAPEVIGVVEYLNQNKKMLVF